ncbi:anti-sigma factor family protein [Pseudonocardia pini]|uniref:anti-sigma factor family protein n=1 Tax=Pseudonocardia pini TaxID=2758030 RepID=UPI0015F09D45|nr:zf-HC2 domain-containing protein [Pseudonocardia pini]
MTRSGNDGHRALRELLGAHALGGLTDAEATALRAHLDGCPACRAELNELESVAVALRAVDPAALDDTPVPPPGLADRIVARTRTVPRPATRRPALAMAAAVLVAALVGGGVGFIAGTGPAVPRETVALRTLASTVQASATVVPHTWGIEITLDADGFDAGTAYRVVVVDDSGRTVEAGAFIGTGPEPMVCNLNTSVLRTQAAGFDVLAPDGSVVVHADL